MKKTIFLAFLILILFSCSTKQSNQQNQYSDSTKQSNQIVQSKDFEIPDSLFALKNISNTDFEKGFCFKKNKFFLDSTKKVELVKLNAAFNQEIIYPILVKYHGFNKEYIKGKEISFFVSKQQKIGEYQPIIIYTSGVDNWCLLLVVVDSTFAPISHTILKGNYGASFEKIGELYLENEYIYSKINNNSITTCKITSYYDNLRSEKEIFKDSIIYKSEIYKNGNIKTQKIDSIRIFFK